jgi:hypothetical protein
MQGILQLLVYFIVLNRLSHQRGKEVHSPLKIFIARSRLGKKGGIGRRGSRKDDINKLGEMLANALML